MRPLYNHCEVKEKSTQRAHQENHHIRDIRDTYKARLSRYFANIGWQCVTNQPIYEEKLQVNLYSNLVEIGISSILSERSNKAYPKDAPWISVKLKELNTPAPARLLSKQIRLLVNLRTRRNPRRYPQVSIPPKGDIKCQDFAALLV